jgi:hypothetical protein
MQGVYLNVRTTIWRFQDVVVFTIGPTRWLKRVHIQNGG